jgi:nitroreductase
MIKEIFEHKSIRKYINKPIPADVMSSILDAAIRASNTGNMQVYSIVVTTDQKIKEALSPTHFNQPMVVQAPAILTFCADFNRFNNWCHARNAEPGYDNFLSFLTAAVDAVIAAQNACLEAENHGLGICYLGTAIYNADKIIDILELPKGVVPVTAVTMGYPDESPKLADRLPREAVVHYEKYKDFSESDIYRIYSEKESLDESKQYIKENNKETLAQVFTDVRYPKANNVHFSKVLCGVLKKQGFLDD